MFVRFRLLFVLTFLAFLWPCSQGAPQLRSGNKVNNFIHQHNGFMDLFGDLFQITVAHDNRDDRKASIEEKKPEIPPSSVPPVNQNKEDILKPVAPAATRQSQSFPLNYHGPPSHPTGESPEVQRQERNTGSPFQPANFPAHMHPTIFYPNPPPRHPLPHPPPTLTQTVDHQNKQQIPQPGVTAPVRQSQSIPLNLQVDQNHHIGASDGDVEAEPQEPSGGNTPSDLPQSHLQHASSTLTPNQQSQYPFHHQRRPIYYPAPGGFPPPFFRPIQPSSRPTLNTDNNHQGQGDGERFPPSDQAPTAENYQAPSNRPDLDSQQEQNVNQNQTRLPPLRGPMFGPVFRRPMMMPHATYRPHPLFRPHPAFPPAAFNTTRNATLPLVPRVGACGSQDLAANPGICVPQGEACPTNDKFRTKAVGFCAVAPARMDGIPVDHDEKDEVEKCCSTLPRNVRNLPVAAAFPGYRCRTPDGRIGKCSRFMRGCTDAGYPNPVALCGAFRNAQLCCSA